MKEKKDPLKDKFQVYLDFLLSEGFVRGVKESIEATEKGIMFLKDYRKLKASLRSRLLRRTTEK